MFLDGVAKLSKLLLEMGLCSVCWVQTCWAMVTGVSFKAFVSHGLWAGHDSRAVLWEGWEPRAVHRANLNVFSPAFT